MEALRKRLARGNLDVAFYAHDLTTETAGGGRPSCSTTKKKEIVG